MKDTQLILVEGIPGSGKSTNSRFVTIQMERNGRPVTWYHEIAKQHPTCYLREATLPLAEFAALEEEVTRGRDEARIAALAAVSARVGEHVAVDLLEVERHRAALGDALTERLQAYDDWNLTAEQYCAAALDKWKLFVERVLASGETVALDCSLFQFQIYGPLLYDWSNEAIKAYVRQVIEIIQPLRPALIYLYQEDMEQSFTRLLAVRGERWVQHIVSRDGQFPFHVARQDTPPVERYKEFLFRMRRISDELMAEEPFANVQIGMLGGDWPRYQQEMLQFLEIPFVADPVVSAETLDSYVGVYRSEEWANEMKVCLDSGTLFVDIPQIGRRKLIPKTERSFYLEDNPIELDFAPAEGGLCIGGTWMYEFCEPGTWFTKIGH